MKIYNLDAHDIPPYSVLRVMGMQPTLYLATRATLMKRGERSFVVQMQMNETKGGVNSIYLGGKR